MLETLVFAVVAFWIVGVAVTSIANRRAPLFPDHDPSTWDGWGTRQHPDDPKAADPLR